MTGKHFIGGLYIERLQSGNGIIIVFTVFNIFKGSWANIISQYLQLIEAFRRESGNKILKSAKPMQPVFLSRARARISLQLPRS